MPVKLKNPYQPADIPSNQMKDGEMGIITRWAAGKYVGRIVQRYANHLIAIGMVECDSWPNWFADREYSHNDCRVRLLQPGEEIVITG